MGGLLAHLSIFAPCFLADQGARSVFWLATFVLFLFRCCVGIVLAGPAGYFRRFAPRQRLFPALAPGCAFQKQVWMSCHQHVTWCERLHDLHRALSYWQVVVAQVCCCPGATQKLRGALESADLPKPSAHRDRSPPGSFWSGRRSWPFSSWRVGCGRARSAHA